jgi:hypothetical protein
VQSEEEALNLRNERRKEVAGGVEEGAKVGVSIDGRGTGRTALE